MTLSNQKYSELKEDTQIAQAISKVKSALVDDKKGRITKKQEHYIGYAEYLSKTITTFENLINDSEAMSVLKIDKYLQYYLYELRKFKHAEPEAVSALEKLKNDTHLTSLLDFKVSDYIQYQIDELKKDKKSFLESRPIRISENTERDRWLRQIILKLDLKGIKKISEKIDFIFRLYKDYNIIDLEYKIDDEVKNYKEYKFEARTHGSYNVERVLRDDPDLAKDIIDEYDPEIEIKKIYDENKADIKSNIRKIVNSALSK